jgi:hypothetical protein
LFSRHHHQVDVLEAAAGNDGLRRTQVGVELELLAQAHVGGTIAAAGRGFQRSLERQPVLADAVDAGLRQRIAAGGDAGQARDLGFPLERRAERVEHLDRRSGDFGADAVSGIRVAGIRLALMVVSAMSACERGVCAPWSLPAAMRAHGGGACQTQLNGRLQRRPPPAAMRPAHPDSLVVSPAAGRIRCRSEYAWSRPC